MDIALEIINDIENILLSIEVQDSFLKSIRIALNHITFSMKGYVLTLCGLDTTVCKTNIILVHVKIQIFYLTLLKNYNCYQLSIDLREIIQKSVE